jgi:hypothetical protein
MEILTMGKVAVAAKIENLHDPSVLIGQISLEGLDFVVDPVGQRLLGNPDHGGEQMVDAL